jgi:hypothetical protein
MEAAQEITIVHALHRGADARGTRIREVMARPMPEVDVSVYPLSGLPSNHLMKSPFDSACRFLFMIENHECTVVHEECNSRRSGKKPPQKSGLLAVSRKKYRVRVT